MQELPSGFGRADVAADGIEVAEVVRTLRRQWRAVMAFIGIGGLGALAVILFAQRQFEGKATLLARAGSSETGGSVLGRLTNGIGGLMSGGVFAGLPSPFEAELQVLRSRVVAGRVVDSLQLQFSVRSPSGVAPFALVAASNLPGLFEPRRYHFSRGSDGVYSTEHDGKTYRLRPGESARIDIGEVTLQKGRLPAEFTVKVYDREDAITRLSKHMQASKAGGDVAAIVYHGEDSLTAAAVPNLIVATYLERRKTVDRGINQRRVEYVTEQLQSTSRALSEAEGALRKEQEQSGVLDAELYGKAWLDGAVAMRESLTTVMVDEGSINQLLDRTRSGALSPRQLAAYPAFLRGSAVSTLASHLTDLEAQRLRLLERRTERDPDVVVLDQNIQTIERQIVALAESYAGALAAHRRGLARQLDSLQAKMLVLPAAAERGGRLVREVTRLNAIHTALQAQLVEAKLAAIGEGGEVRPIDLAVPPREVAFPKPWLTMGIGTFGGFLAGCVAALLLGWFGRWMRDPIEIERATGIAAQRLDSRAPLLISGRVTRSVLVIPLGAGAQTAAVAERVAQTAAARALRASVLNLSVAHNGNGSEPSEHPAAAIERLERQGDLVVVQLPPLDTDTTVAALHENRPVLLVAPPGPVDRVRLSSALDILRRLGAPCAGVVISDPVRRVIRA